MNKLNILILIVSIIGCILATGCFLGDSEAKTISEAKEQEVARKEKERLRLSKMTVTQIRAEIEKDLLRDQYEGKKKSDEDTRATFYLVQKIAGFFLFIGLAAAYFLPVGRKKWGYGTVIVCVAAIVICATLSYYLHAIRIVALIIIGLVVVALGIVGVLWIRKSSALNQVVETVDKMIKKNPEGFQELIDDKEIKHDDSTKAQVKAVKKKKGLK